jgi:hypothetical protein
MLEQDLPEDFLELAEESFRYACELAESREGTE